MSDASAPAYRDRWTGMGLFALSFTALFLELMLIRWVPVVVRLVAYYANLMLISSFLGLGLGAMLARQRRWKLMGWFPLLLAADIGILHACSYAILPVSPQEARFFISQATFVNYLILVLIFVSNTVLFVPIGQRIGEYFRQLPPLRAYCFDLGGSLCGTLAFGAFSLFCFSPVYGLLIVMGLYLCLAEKRGRLAGAVLFPLVLVGVMLGTERGGIWSPYYYITVTKLAPDMPSDYTPPPNLRTMHDPPVYLVRVGRDFYQQDATIEMDRYSPGVVRDWMQPLHDQYVLPYKLAERMDRVAILGAGGGMDVQGALLSGAGHVDAVEIDPRLAELSLKINASGVYDDPRVRRYTDDARAFLRRSSGGYDVIAFSYLDSQSLFSSMSNLRLDGFIYTVESMRSAWSKLGPDGMLSVAFSSPSIWVPPKIVQMLRQATGREPISYVGVGSVILCVPKGAYKTPPPSLGSFQRMPIEYPKLDLPTDDWPYLYLSRRTIPADYLTVIATLLALSLAAVVLIRRGEATGIALTRGDAHFALLGLAFLLLQTKSITDCSLYFGTTWLVTTIVVAGVLGMVLASTLVAMRLKSAGRWYYAPLLASLVGLYFVPRDLILAQALGVRLAWALLAMPLPIFFAGLIFSTTFRRSPDPSIAFGANLIGATVGGFTEYLGMAIGTHRLWLIVMAAYAGSFLCIYRTRKSPTPAVAEVG